MSTKNQFGLPEYREAFEGRGEEFLFYYRFGGDGRISRHHWTRSEFWVLARKAAGVLRAHGLNQRDTFCLCVGANQPFDLAFRLGSVMTGATAVTINWQADTVERICYKIELTQCKLIVCDTVFDPKHLTVIRERFPDTPLFRLTDLEDSPELDRDQFLPGLPAESTRLIIFTSGTTGQPKGVELPYRAYRANRETFEQFLEIEPRDRFAVLIVNPLHHANSSAISDWAMRRPRSHIHLLPRYATDYWKILIQVADSDYDRVVAPTVSRHFDFLETLDNAHRLPAPVGEFKTAMQKVDFLIGSAPVGPTTIERLLRYTGRIPPVRFGATETCLQSLGIPVSLPEKAKLKAFESGWRHRVGKNPQPGYYIGRPHRPLTDARVVESITEGEVNFMRDARTGQPGYIVVSGDHLMGAYTRQPDHTRRAFHQNWYLGLRDICFTLVSAHDGELDFYWMSRDSMMLIRGGANYAFDQINSEIQAAITGLYGLNTDDFDLAVVGLKVGSEHEDACCLTIEARTPETEEKLAAGIDQLKDTLNRSVSKSAKIDFLRFGTIPRNFKGAVLVKDLAAAFQRWLDRTPRELPIRPTGCSSRNRT